MQHNVTVFVFRPGEWGDRSCVPWHRDLSLQVSCVKGGWVDNLVSCLI